MFAKKSKKITLTLIVSLVLILSLLPVSVANDFQALPRRSHNRLIKKRSPQKGSVLGPLVGAAPDPKAADTTSASLTSTSESSSRASSSSSSSASSASSTPASSSSSSRSSVSSSSSSSSSSNSSSSSSSSTASSPSSSSVASNTNTSDTSKPTQTSSDEVVVVTDSAGAVVTVTQTSTKPTSTDAERTQAGAASNTNTNKARNTALTVLIVIASSVGAVLLFWTIFRKWKLARSSKFDQRLQPIDWQPTSGDEGIIPANRRRNSNASSFRSGYGATSEVGHGPSDHGHRGGVPDHDFTAGPSHLAPVGGYADLARGPSPQPMQQLGSGPSFNRPNYDVGVPLHHQAPYGARY